MPRSDLAAFATAVAERLPGIWTSTYHRHAAYRDQFPLAEHVWDNGHADWAITQFVLGHDAVLTGPGHQSLYVIDRPLHPGQFLVAALAPDGFKDHHFHGVNEPNGIAVHQHPARAAAQITRRLLPRYRHALNAVRDNAHRQPETPPRRPAPPAVSQVVTLTWYGDGALTTPAAGLSQDAKTTLYLQGFQYHPQEDNFLLPTAYGDTGRAVRIQAAAQQLAAHGIGVNLRFATSITLARPRVSAAKQAPVLASARPDPQRNQRETAHPAHPRR
ncbi:hypothetical protein [Streptomyces sp. NPDC056244]|uniref:hypothetical protein n=1 Tax=Streptomyces sp. NPDC056244 TaxID=3345762 RepID=UPI0035DEC6E1